MSKKNENKFQDGMKVLLSLAPKASTTPTNNEPMEDNEGRDTFVMPEPERSVEEPCKPEPIFEDMGRMNGNITKCKDCRIFDQCELAAEERLIALTCPEAELPTYIKTERDTCLLRGGFILEPCGKKYVSEGIGDDYHLTLGRNFKIDETDYDSWNPHTPVFISAQTGQGKNYFVEDRILSYVRELNLKNKTNLKVLIVSNRIALKMQVKKRVNSGLFRQDDDENQPHYNYKGYECAEVITYQGFLNRIGHYQRMQKDSQARYLYVICDEAHFFTSDANFNPDTERILSALVKTFSNAIRIYMSATPYECLEYLSKHDKGKWLFYHFVRDYSYLDIKYYTERDELVDRIVESKEKWLIFIDNIDDCDKLKKTLDEAYSVAYPNKEESDVKKWVFTASAKSKSDETYQHTVLNEVLWGDTKVLITTSVLDNGVNFRNVSNVVVSEASKVKCLQMVGRARIGEKLSKVTLYVKRFDTGDIEKHIKSLFEQQNVYHNFDSAYDRPLASDENVKGYNYKQDFLDRYDPRKGGKAADWFKREEDPQPVQDITGDVYYNGIARSLIEPQLNRYKSILGEMIKTDTENSVIKKLKKSDSVPKEVKITGQRYLEYMLSWFGKVYDRNNDITLSYSEVGLAEAKGKLIEFLESYAISQEMLYGSENDSGTQIGGFCIAITEKIDNAFGRQDKNADRNYHKAKINRVLNDKGIGYEIRSDREPTGARRTYWEIVRKDGEATENQENDDVPNNS